MERHEINGLFHKDRQFLPAAHLGSVARPYPQSRAHPRRPGSRSRDYRLTLELDDPIPPAGPESVGVIEQSVSLQKGIPRLQS